MSVGQMAIFFIIFDATYIQIHPVSATHEGTSAVAYRRRVRFDAIIDKSFPQVLGTRY